MKSLYGKERARAIRTALKSFPNAIELLETDKKALVNDPSVIVYEERTDGNYRTVTQEVLIPFWRQRKLFFFIIHDKRNFFPPNFSVPLDVRTTRIFELGFVPMDDIRGENGFLVRYSIITARVTYFPRNGVKIEVEARLSSKEPTNDVAVGIVNFLNQVRTANSKR